MFHSPFDCVIVGAGASGLTCALALAAQGRRVAIIGQVETGQAGRTVALLGPSLALMETLGLAGALRADGCPLDIMRLVDATGSLFQTGQTDFVAAEIGQSSFGKNIENDKLLAHLAAHVAATPGITHLKAHAQSFAFEDDHVSVTTDTGTTVLARLLVAADGRGSPARTAAGISAQTWTYPQVAITVLLAHDLPHENVSTEFHTRAGPCTLVPLPGSQDAPHRSSLVWMMTPLEARRRLALSDTDLARAIEVQTHSILGSFRVLSGRGTYPMGGLRVERVSARRTALVGDAAHGFPPIGAQGLNLGLRDVATLVVCLDGAQDPGAQMHLNAYQAQREPDIRLRTTAVDVMNRALLDHSLPMDFLRGVGLTALAHMGPLRRLAMRQGLGGM